MATPGLSVTAALILLSAVAIPSHAEVGVSDDTVRLGEVFSLFSYVGTPTRWSRCSRSSPAPARSATSPPSSTPSPSRPTSSPSTLPSRRAVPGRAAFVSQAGQHMEEVVEKVDEVAKLIAEVSLSSRQQVDEISQIDGPVSNLEQMTRQNATLSERTTSAAMSLLEQSRALDESVSVLSLPEAERSRPDPAGSDSHAGRTGGRRAA